MEEKDTTLYIETQSSSVLMEEIANLKYEVQQQADIIETQRQELHTANKRLECLSAMKVEMEIEIEALNGLHAINGNLESKVKALENELSAANLRSQHLESSLTDERRQHDTMINEMTSQLAEIRREIIVKSDELVNVAVADINKKCTLLQEQLNAALRSNEELNNKVGELGAELQVCQHLLSDKSKICDELKEALQLKSENLKSSSQLVQELQDEKAVLSSEMASLKNATLSKRDIRGNSLFGEVEERRVVVESKLQMMNQKYKELKKSLMKKNAEIKRLELENHSLRQQWKEDKNLPYESVGSLVQGYKSHIEDLNQLLTELKKRPESPQIISSSDLSATHMACIHAVLEQERTTVRELRAELEQRSMRELFQNEQLFDMKQKLRSMKAQAMNDAAALTELRLALEASKSAIEDTEGKLVDNDCLEKNVLKNVNHSPTGGNAAKKVCLGAGSNVAKKVTFCDSTNDPVASERSETAAINASSFKKKPSIYEKACTVKSTRVDKENVF